MITLHHNLESAYVTLGRLGLLFIFVELKFPHNLLQTALAEKVQLDLFMVFYRFGVELDLEGLLVLVFLPLLPLH